MSISGNQFVDVGNELGNSVRVRTGSGEVVNLDKNTDTINEARVEVALMGSSLKAKLVNKKLDNETLKTGTGFGVTLKGTIERKDMFTRVKIFTKMFAIPGAIGIVDSNVARFLRRGDC